MSHEPECGVMFDDGWQPPCVKPTHVPAHEYDYPSCTFCWDREDNCHCTCEPIRAGYKRGYFEGFNDHARAQQHWQDTHGAYTQHGEGENP